MIGFIKYFLYRIKNMKGTTNSVHDAENIRMICLEKLENNDIYKTEPTIIKTGKPFNKNLYEYSVPRDDKACDRIEISGCSISGNYSEICPSTPKNIRMICLEKLANNDITKAEPTIIKAGKPFNTDLYEYSVPRDDKACDMIESSGCLISGHYSEICPNPSKNIKSSSEVKLILHQLLETELTTLNSEELLLEESEQEFVLRDNEVCNIVDFIGGAIGHYCPTTALSGEDQLLEPKGLFIIPVDNDQEYPGRYPNLELPGYNQLLAPDNLHIATFLIASFLIKFFHKKTKKMNTQFKDADSVQDKQSPTPDRADRDEISTAASSRRASLGYQLFDNFDRINSGSQGLITPKPAGKSNGGNPFTPPGRNDQDEISTQDSWRRASFGAQRFDDLDTIHPADQFEANQPKRGDLSVMPKQSPTYKHTKRSAGRKKNTPQQKKGRTESFVNLPSQPDKEPVYSVDASSPSGSDSSATSRLESLSDRSVSDGGSIQGNAPPAVFHLETDMDDTFSQEAQSQTTAAPVAESPPPASAAATASQQPPEPALAPDIPMLTQNLAATDSTTPLGTSSPAMASPDLIAKRLKLKQIISRYNK